MSWGKPVSLSDHWRKGCVGGVCQGDGGLGVDQTRIRACEGVCTDVVLLHPAQPTPRQRRDVRADHRFEPKVTGLREQDRTQTDGEVCYTCGAFADMGKFMGEPGARMEFEEDLRQVHVGQSGEDVVTQRA